MEDLKPACYKCIYYTPTETYTGTCKYLSCYLGIKEIVKVNRNFSCALFTPSLDTTTEILISLWDKNKG